MTDLSNLLTTREAAAYAGYSLNTIRGYVWAKLIPSVKVGIQSFIKKSDLDVWMARNK